MSYMDLEIERVKHYCKGLGINLIFSSESGAGDSATWQSKPLEIVVYKKSHKSKTEIILSLLHEIGHSLYYTHNDRPAIPDAYVLESNRKKSDPPIPKSERKKILDYERNGISYMTMIATELSLKIPMWKVEFAAARDLWAYEYYYDTGKFPTMKQKIEKKRQLRPKYKGT